MLADKSHQQQPNKQAGDLWVYELLYVPVLAVDTGFNIIYINEKACEVTGYSKEDVKGKKLFDIAGPGEMKKKLLRLFSRQFFERDFTVRSRLVTKSGRIREVEWQCRAMYQGFIRAGAVITFVDLTGAETVIDLAQLMAGATSLEMIVCDFMDLLSRPLNLKLARTCLRGPDGQTLTFSRAYPHGGVHKKPRYALSDSHTASPADVYAFSLEAGDKVLGRLELTTYGGSSLTVEDEAYVGRLCGILSSGVCRMFPTVPTGSDPPARPRETAAPGPENRDGKAAGETVEDAEIARRLMGMLPHGIILCDRSGRITSANPSAAGILGIEKARLEEMTVAEMAREIVPERISGASIGASRMAICRALRTGNPVLNTVSTILVDGTRREVNISAMPVRDGAGNVAGCMATVSDITVIGAIVKLGRLALNSPNTDDFIEESMDMIMNAVGLRLASLYLWDGNELRLRVMKGEQAGMPLPECRDTPDPSNPTLQSRAFLSGKPLLIKDYRRCPSVRLFDPLARKRPVRSMAGVPLTGESGPIGVLLAATDEGHPMDESLLAGLSSLCSQMSAGINRVLRV